jgi:hypothetical protein
MVVLAKFDANPMKRGGMNIGDNLNRYSDKICWQIGNILE